jgi:hypothetical protein
MYFPVNIPRNGNTDEHCSAGKPHDCNPVLFQQTAVCTVDSGTRKLIRHKARAEHAKITAEGASPGS